MDFSLFAELAINGALSGLMYSLVAMGIVIIYKSSSVPNLAQGAMTMLGAYVVLAIANGLGVSMWVAIPLAMLLGFIGWGDVPTPMKLAGACIIVGSGLFIFYRERQLALRVQTR